MTATAATVTDEGGQWLGHPRGLFYLFFAEMWERFCYYGMRAILILYMTKYFLFSDNVASGVYGAYTSLIYCVAIFGGFLADQYLGYRRSIIFGGILMALGEFALLVNRETMSMIGVSISTGTESLFFYGGLATIIVGNGFFKPNISTVVGKLYSAGDPRRDGGFTIFYIGINVGALVSGLVCGWVGEKYGWNYGFGLAGLGMLLGIVTFARGRASLQGKGEPISEATYRRTALRIGIGAIAVIPAFGWLLLHNEWMGWILGGTWLVVVIALLKVAFSGDKAQRERIFALIVLLVFNIAFWAFFEQAGSSLTLFADRNTDLNVFGWMMPASWAQQFNPLFIMVFGAIFARMWVQLGRRNRDPSIPMKFSLGLIQLGLGFGVLVMGARLCATDGMTPLAFLVLLYLLQTTGELCLSPVGLSMVTKLAPPNVTGMVMGAWFLSISAANYAAGLISKLTGEAGGSDGKALPPAESLVIYTDVYWQGFLIACGAGVVLMLLVPVLKKWMHGVK